MLLTRLPYRVAAFFASGLLNVGIFSMSDMLNATLSDVVSAQPSQKSLLLSQGLPDFDEDDEFEQAGEGIHAVYVDRAGNVLGTFVNIPNAQIKVYASGQIEITKQTYTVETNYGSDGQIRTIGRTRFRYFNNGRIREIDDIDFRYFNSGRLKRIANIDFSYFSSGRLRRIEQVRFRYSANDRLETISAAQTNSGIRIVIVN
ncbi:MAG: hypothetical protein ACFB2W_21555 [Leptolyngbyaceae cyanobacterium]